MLKGTLNHGTQRIRSEVALGTSCLARALQFSALSQLLHRPPLMSELLNVNGCQTL